MEFNPKYSYRLPCAFSNLKLATGILTSSEGLQPQPYIIHEDALKFDAWYENQLRTVYMLHLCGKSHQNAK